MIIKNSIGLPVLAIGYSIRKARADTYRTCRRPITHFYQSYGIDDQGNSLGIRARNRRPRQTPQGKNSVRLREGQRPLREITNSGRQMDDKHRCEMAT